MNGVNVFAMVSQSEWRVKQGIGDTRDYIIIEQWKLSKSQEENYMRLKKDFDKQKQKIAELTSALDIKDSRLELIAHGPQSNVGAWLKGLCPSTQLMA